MEAVQLSVARYSLCSVVSANSLSHADLLQAAMDTGTALATVIIFFCLSYNGITFNWWGNTVGSDTDDANSVPWLKVPTGSYFGKGLGEF